MIEQLVLLSFATFAISLIATTESGPFMVFERWRDWLESGLEQEPQQPDNNTPLEAWHNYHEYYPEWYSERYQSLRGTVFGIFNYPLCLGAYVSFLLVVVYSGIAFNFIDWLAVYGGHLFIYRISERG